MSMRCIVVTPEKTALSIDTTFAVLPLVDGEYGVLPGHAALIARLGAGELRITAGEGVMTNYYVEGGFVEVLHDTIALMTMYAVPAKELDLAQCEEMLEQAENSPTDTHALIKIRQEKLQDARARVKLAQKMAAK